MIFVFKKLVLFMMRYAAKVYMCVILYRNGSQLMNGLCKLMLPAVLSRRVLSKSYLLHRSTHFVIVFIRSFFLRKVFIVYLYKIGINAVFEFVK